MCLCTNKSWPTKIPAVVIMSLRGLLEKQHHIILLIGV